MEFGNIENMVRNDFDHQKKYQDLFFIKRNLGFLLIIYRSLRIKLNIFSNYLTFFYISNLMSTPRFFMLSKKGKKKINYLN